MDITDEVVNLDDWLTHGDWLMLVYEGEWKAVTDGGCYMKVFTDRSVRRYISVERHSHIKLIEKNGNKTGEFCQAEGVYIKRG